MVKKGPDFFTMSGSIMEKCPLKAKCCEICTSPFLNICKIFCKYRKAAYEEFLDGLFSKK